jgi:hypothetical protein
MQVPMPSLQHEVMIEAVENHNPEVIIIDEIGRELEAQAARTIAERGVQLIGTAHGITLDNLLLNPTLSDLVGGIESVTLSDEEARRRGTQKTVLERRAPPTFDVLVELQDRNTLHVHPDVMQAVDSLLRGRPLQPEIRHRNADGTISIEEAPQNTEASQFAPTERGRQGKQQARGKGARRGNGNQQPQDGNGPRVTTPAAAPVERAAAGPVERAEQTVTPTGQTIRVYPYGIARNRLIESARRFRLSLRVVDALEDADVLLTLKNFYRRRPRLISDAERSGVPIYVLRSNTVTQIEDFLVDFFDLALEVNNPLERALRETQEAIQAVMGGAAAVDLAPQKASIRRQQHELVREANLLSHSYGKEPDRHVRIYRE